MPIDCHIILILAAICSPQCVHGSCTSPNTCSCNSGWTGSTCNKGLYIANSLQFTNSRIILQPFVLLNVLMEGLALIPILVHALADGLDQLVIQVCIANKLLYYFYNNFPAICSPQCANGGTCTKPNTCSCNSGWTGSTCNKGLYIANSLQFTNSRIILQPFVLLNVLMEGLALVPILVHALADGLDQLVI